MSKEMQKRRDWLTLPEVASLLGLSYTGAMYHLKQGRFPGAEIVGNLWIIPKESLQAFGELPITRRPRRQNRERQHG